MAATSPTHSRRGMRLERVLGMSLASQNCLAVNPADKYEIAYPAGCVVVLYCSRMEKQRAYMRMAKPVACFAYSRDGKYLAVGERGHNPAITVWDVASHVRVAELKSHRFGVSCLSFAPCGTRLASVGFEHDDTLVVWNWPRESVEAQAKLTEKVLALDFHAEGHTLVTAGEKHVRFWALSESPAAGDQDGSDLDESDADLADAEGAQARQGDNKPKSKNVLKLVEHHAGIMPDFKGATFTDVVCGTGSASGSTYLVTLCGSLICLGANRLMEKWVFLEAESAHSVSLREGKLLCACSAGTIRVFEAESFDFVATLPLPSSGGDRAAAKGAADPAARNKEFEDEEDGNEGAESSEGANGSDALCAVWAGDGDQVVSIYGDRRFFVWDASDLEDVRLKACLLSHPTGVSGVASMRASIFVTCADDAKLRFWRVGGFSSKKRGRTLQGPQWESPLSQELLRELELGPGPGFRAVGLSADGRLVAAGDRNGGLVVYDLDTDDCVLRESKAHASEILSLAFSPRVRGKVERCFLATAGRDREVHIYEVQSAQQASSSPSSKKPAPSLRRAQTLKDHSAVVTAVRFSVDGKRLLSTGGDKTIVLSALGADGKYVRQKSVNVPYGTIHDVDVDASNKYFCTSGQDKKINIWSLSNGKPIRSYKPEGDPGELTKVLLDPAGMYCATGSHDKAIRLLDFYSGDCLAKSSGHGEPITGLAFSTDCKRLVSVSRDGCVFVWRLAPEIYAAIKERKRELDFERAHEASGNEENDTSASRANSNAAGGALEVETAAEVDKDDKEEEIIFARSQLPAWAKTRAGATRAGEDGKEAGARGGAGVDDDDDEEEDDDDEEERKESVSGDRRGGGPLDADDLMSTISPRSGAGSADGSADSSRGSHTASPPPGLPIARSAADSTEESDETIRSLAQERAALKRQEAQQDTEDAVKRMRAKLKTMGLLKATIEMKKEKQRERMDAQQARTQQQDQLEQQQDRAETHASRREGNEGARARGKPRPLVTGPQGSGSPGNAGASGSPAGSGRARMASFRDRIEEDDAIFPPPAPLEPPTPLSPKGRQPERSPRPAPTVPSLVPVPEEVLAAPTLDDSLRSRGAGAGAGGAKRPETATSQQAPRLQPVLTSGAPLRSAEEARSACELALSQVRAALSNTAEVLRQVESLDANLTESLTRSQGGDAFAATVLETSRSHVRDLMSDFKTQLNSVVTNEVTSITSSRGGGLPSAFPADSGAQSQLNRSMFLGSMPSVSGSDVAQMMDKLSALTSLLEQQVARK